MIVSAKLKNVRISSQKIKPVLDKIRLLKVENAINILTYTNKKAAYLIKKLLISVMANAENNNNLSPNNLYIHRIYATDGMKLKRLKTRAKGRSDRIIKKHSHIFVYIKEKE